MHNKVLLTMKQKTEEEFSLIGYFKLAIRYKRVFVISIFIFSLVGGFLFLNQSPEYTAKAGLIFEEPAVYSDYTLRDIQSMSEIKALVESHYLVDKVSERVGGNTGRVKFSSQGEVISLSYMGEDPKIAATVVNEMGNLLIEENIKKRSSIIEDAIKELNVRITNLEEEMETVGLSDKMMYKGGDQEHNLTVEEHVYRRVYSNLLEEKQILKVTSMIPSSELKFLNKAEVPSAGSTKSPMLVVGLAVFGFVFAFGVVHLFEFFKKK